MKERKFLFFVLLLGVLSGCWERSGKADSENMPVTEEVIAPVIEEDDTLEIVERKPVPVIDDGYFDDFIYTFATDEQFQRERIKFPLPVYNLDEALYIEEDEWQHDELFLSEDYYTLLFDKEDDMDLIADTAVHSVQFEWIYLKDMVMKKYYFERVEGMWVLEAVNQRQIDNEKNDDFIHFYEKFANDNIFQEQHIKNPLTFITLDPDDEFSILETFIDAKQWLAFCPVLPVEKLTNINYGQEGNDHSVEKILKISGVGSGYSNLLYFRKVRNKWELYRFEDTSV